MRKRKDFSRNKLRNAKRKSTRRIVGLNLLLSSKGNLDQDLSVIRQIRSANPELFIVLIDATGDETNFLQCIRAGVRGYLPRDASAEDVVDAVKAIYVGKAVCPGSLCAALFR